MDEHPQRSRVGAASSAAFGTSLGQVAGLQLAGAIVDVTRVLARSMPPPRGAPYFYLDSAAAYDLRVFDSLSARGIFRKYEFALDIGSGLGGRARWLAARTGCSIVGVDPSVAVVTAATMLNRRAHMEGQVRFQVGRMEQLPLRDRVFTHVWMLDVTSDAALPAMVTEAFRVLRRGGHVALQCPPLSVARRADLLAMLSTAGFVELETHEVTLAEPPDARRVAAVRLQVALHSHADAEALLSRLPSLPREPTRLQMFGSRVT
jgi:SAM-dependent methyltransferase